MAQQRFLRDGRWATADQLNANKKEEVSDSSEEKSNVETLTKAQIAEELKNKGIPFNANAKKDELLSLLSGAAENLTPTEIDTNQTETNSNPE